MIKNQIQENPGNSSLKGNDKQFELVRNSNYPRSSCRGSTGTFSEKITCSLQAANALTSTQ